MVRKAVSKTEPESVDIEDLAAELRPLFLQEEDAKWAIGDLLAKSTLSDAKRSKLAKLLRREVSTLARYERVAREFPEGKDEGESDRGLPWGVYSHLTEVTSEDAVVWREEFLLGRHLAPGDKKNEDVLFKEGKFSPTSGVAERAVRVKKMSERAVRLPGGRQKSSRDTAVTPEAEVHLEFDPNTSIGKLVLHGTAGVTLRVGNIQQNEISRFWELTFAIDD